MALRLLDLFCGAGGAAVGYSRAGFDVVGVDIAPQPSYPFTLVEGDALEYLAELVSAGRPELQFDAVHASPPCQAYVALSKGDHPRLIEPTRELLQASGLPYIIENVVGAPLVEPVTLCGSMFGLGVRRHRLFETNFPILVPSCAHGAWTRRIRAYYGKRGWAAWTGADNNVQSKSRLTPLLRGSVELADADMGIDWMVEWDELREAIPPVYTEVVGAQLFAQLSTS